MSIQTLVFFLMVGAFGIALIAMVGTAFFTVDQRTTAIVQRFGRFLREAGPGLHVKIPFIDQVIGRINLRVQQLDVTTPGSLAELRRAFDDDHIGPTAARRELSVETVGVSRGS